MEPKTLESGQCFELAEAAEYPMQHKPSAFYFRRALRRAKTAKDKQEVGEQAIRELAHITEWAKSLGLNPPVRYVMQSEVDAKNLRRLGGMRLRVLAASAILLAQGQRVGPSP